MFKFAEIACMLAFTAMPAPALAEWELIGSNGNEFSIFGDFNASTKSNRVVTVQQLTIYGEPQAARSPGSRYVSETAQVAYDCAARRLRTIVVEQYEGDRATGHLVARVNSPDAAWEPVPGNTNAEVAWRRACNLT